MPAENATEACACFKPLFPPASMIVREHSYTIRLADISEIYIQASNTDCGCLTYAPARLHIKKTNNLSSSAIVIDAPLNGDEFVSQVYAQMKRVENGEVKDTPPPNILQSAQVAPPGSGMMSSLSEQMLNGQLGVMGGFQQRDRKTTVEKKAEVRKEDQQQEAQALPPMFAHVMEDRDDPVEGIPMPPMYDNDSTMNDKDYSIRDLVANPIHEDEVMDAVPIPETTTTNSFKKF
jgi:hypothetical protein